jgi:hypothetical protein
MNSPLSINEFRERLKSNTRIGDPKLKGSPFAVFTIFGHNKKTFYGEYDKRHFRLTRNEFIPETPFIIDGYYKSKNNFETKINIKIEPIKFGYYWIIYGPILGILFLNFMLFTTRSNIEIVIPILVNLFSLPMLIPSLMLKRKKKKFANEFYRLFEISVEQTT